MFTMAKIRDGSTYLGRHLSANDYYSEGEKVQGVWIGSGAEKLGIGGQFIDGKNQAFEDLRNNRHPDGSGKLTARDRADRIKFFDFQCSAQKSVSILAVTLGDERLLRAHDEAAKKAFLELEKFAAVRQTGSLDYNNRPTGNVAAAVFRHTASRALDPQVHTHFVVANATWDEKSKRWKALTEEDMVRAIRYAGKVYQNELARECRLLGYNIEEVRDKKRRVTGFEITGVSEDLRARFSKRRAEVEAGIDGFKQKRGREPSAAEVHVITTETRNTKLLEITTPEVLAKQRAQLSAAELSHLEDLKTAALASARAGGTGVDLGLGREKEGLRAAVGHEFERRSVLAGHEILAEALNQRLGHVDLAKLKPQLSDPVLCRLTDEKGHSPLSQLYATKVGLDMEKWAVDFVNRTKGHSPALASAELSKGFSPDQTAALKKLLSSSDQVLSLRGVAGAGKTTVVRELDRVLARPGRAVFYSAPTASAAQTLRKEGLPTATTLSDFLQNVAVKDEARLKGAVFIVDEAGLISHRQGVDVLRLAERHGARVLFIGDSAQHSSVEAGDFLRVLETHSRIDQASLTDIRRQTHEVYRDAVKLLSKRAARPGLEVLDKLGWVHEGKAQYLENAASEFLNKAEHGKALGEVLAVTPTWAENHRVTDAIRDGLKGSGHLQGGENVTVHEPLQWTKPQKKNAANYEVGQVVRFNEKAKGIRAGDWAVVVAVGNALELRFPDGRAQTVEPEKIANKVEVCTVREIEIAQGDRLLVRANARTGGLVNGQLLTVTGVSSGKITTAEGVAIDAKVFRDFGHGYVVTSHKAQGKTTRHVIVAAETLDTRAAYVGCSRGRETCSVHTPDKDHLFDKLRRGERKAALDVLSPGGSDKTVTPLSRTPAPSLPDQAVTQRGAHWLALARERLSSIPQDVRNAVAAVWSRGVRELGELSRLARIPGMGRDNTPDRGREI